MEVSGGIFWLDRGRWTFFMGGWRDIFYRWVEGHFLWVGESGWRQVDIFYG